MNSPLFIAGLCLKNPILTASGTFGYGLEFSRFGDLKELGGIVVKGLSLEPRPGNPMERIVETPCGMLNSIGLQNIGAREFVTKRLPRLPWKEVAIIANLYAQSREEFAELAGYLAAQEGIAALEVNISCPNVSGGGIAFGKDPVMAQAVTAAVKKQAGTLPVIVKLSPDVTDITEIARACVSGGADALSLINTLSGMAIDPFRRKLRLANGIGGLSGPAIKPVALRCVYQVARAVDVPLIGIGGISCAQDVLEFILAGATAVQVGTANFARPDASFRLVKELACICADNDITSWDEYRKSLN